MARVKAIAPFYDNVVLRQPDEEFDFDGPPGSAIVFLNPKDKEAAERKLAATLAKNRRSSVVASVRAEELARIRAEVIAEERAKIEAEVRGQIKAELAAAGQNDASELV
jgi:hypothetical protein